MALGSISASLGATALTSPRLGDSTPSAARASATTIRSEAFSSSHGLDADERGTVEALLASTRDAIDGMIFGVGWQEAPAPAIAAARRSAYPCHPVPDIT